MLKEKRLGLKNLGKGQALEEVGKRKGRLNSS